MRGRKKNGRRCDAELNAGKNVTRPEPQASGSKAIVVALGKEENVGLVVGRGLGRPL